MITNKTLILLAASAIALGSPLAPVSAEEFTATATAEPSVTISIADLDLAAPAGMARLNSRIRGAANGLCFTTDVEPLETRLARAKCFRTAVSSGEWQVEQKSAARTASTRTATASLPSVGR